MQEALFFFTCFSLLDQRQAEVLKENMSENESRQHRTVEQLDLLWAQLRGAIQPENSNKNADGHTSVGQEAGD